MDTCTVPAVPPDNQIRVLSSVTYATMGGQDLLMDIAGPLDNAPHPAVMVVHGGGWRLGSRTEFDSFIRILAGLGYVAATVDYRLAAAPNNMFPAAEQDVRCALAFLRSNAATLTIDPARVGVLGGSAGGHLVSLLATTPDDTSLDGACPVTGQSLAVHAVVSLAGPQDLRSSQLFGSGASLGVDGPAVLRNFLGGDPEQVPVLAAQASPVVHVTGAAPPFFFVHGTADDLVLVQQSRNMRVALQAAGVPATLYEAVGAGHGINITPAQQLTQNCTVVAFLDHYLQP